MPPIKGTPQTYDLVQERMKMWVEILTNRFSPLEAFVFIEPIDPVTNIFSITFRLNSKKNKMINQIKIRNEDALGDEIPQVLHRYFEEALYRFEERLRTERFL